MRRKCNASKQSVDVLNFVASLYVILTVASLGVTDKLWKLCLLLKRRAEHEIEVLLA